jgi:hypothetical protein
LKKRTKKLLLAASRPTVFAKPHSERGRAIKSFLVLFFKKELLPILIWERNLG